MNVTALPTSCHDVLPEARFKSTPEDFQVDELLGFVPDGEGEHLWLRLRKTSQNTRDLIELLARHFKVAARDLGYSGLKDKHAVTTQWISLPVAAIPENSLADIANIISELLSALKRIEVLEITRSRKKLRTGAHRQNSFRITLRDVTDVHDLLESRLALVSKAGFPNYFGEQRFGHDGRNVAAARSMFQGNRKTTRFKRGIYLSAARSYLFNRVLATRVADDNWQRVLPGEACILDGTNSVFHCGDPDDEIKVRYRQLDIHTSGPLYGRGQSIVTGAVATLESDVLDGESALVLGLEKAGLKQERRALRAIAHNMSWIWSDQHTLELSVTLQRGVYATSLLRELVNIKKPTTIPEPEHFLKEQVR